MTKTELKKLESKARRLAREKEKELERVALLEQNLGLALDGTPGLKTHDAMGIGQWTWEKSRWPDGPQVLRLAEVERAFYGERSDFEAYHG